MLLAVLAASAFLQAQAASTIVGTWRGTSLCTKSPNFPACHDETVIYEVAGPAPDGTVMLKADKIVKGQREPMGELPFEYDAHADAWVSEFTRRSHTSRWSLQIRGAEMTGTLIDVPTGEVVRNVKLRRQ